MEILESKANRELKIAEREQLFREFDCGLWTSSQYRKKVHELEGRELDVNPAKRCHIDSPKPALECQSSPDWNQSLPSSDDSI